MGRHFCAEGVVSAKFEAILGRQGEGWDGTFATKVLILRNLMTFLGVRRRMGRHFCDEGAVSEKFEAVSVRQRREWDGTFAMKVLILRNLI